MVEINPLQLASQFQPKPADTSVIDKLKASAALQGITDRAAGARSTATDLSRLTGVLAPHGLSPGALTPDILDPIRGQIGAERGGSAISSAAAGGVRIPKGTPSFTLPDTYKQKTESGFALKGEAAELAKGKIVAEQKKRKKIKGKKRVPGKGFVEFEEEDTDTQTGTIKGGPVKNNVPKRYKLLLLLNLDRML